MLINPSLATHNVIIVQLDLEARKRSAPEREELVLHALAATLAEVANSSAMAWTVQAIAGGEPYLYALTPLVDTGISNEEIWAMIIVLRAQPGIGAAEPGASFG